MKTIACWPEIRPIRAVAPKPIGTMMVATPAAKTKVAPTMPERRRMPDAK
ncbi:hypothetical protein QN354_04065 [Cryobacterium sp. 5I3]|nr:hypothetical protein [Cryobacterium sp. 5I3]MEB0200932.1 hypothetical protein [Cryobacterium sp. 5I3]